MVGTDNLFIQLRVLIQLSSHYACGSHVLRDQVSYFILLLIHDARHLINSSRIMICSPGCKSAETGNHYSNPTNHFWKCLHRSGKADLT